MLKIDGSYGEGGGQIIRTALTLSCITSIPVEIYNIRAGRKKPGLRPQHVTCIEAAADICDAEILGGHTGSNKMIFRPGRAVRVGNYQWSIPTAGAATLVLQTVLLPLALAQNPSTILVTGGTHVPFSPSAHFVRDAYVPMMVQSGADVVLELKKFGWNPKGGGEILASIGGGAQLKGQQLVERGELERIFGVGLVSNLPAHIPQRMTDHVLAGLTPLNTFLDVRPVRGKGRGTGAGLFLTAEYSNGRAGFDVLGEKGLPSEEVANLALRAVHRFNASHATVDKHLADQILLILALAEGKSRYITEEVTSHLQTNQWVIQQFLEREITIDPASGTVNIAG